MNNIADLVLDGFHGEAIVDVADAADHDLTAIWSLAAVGKSYVQLVAWLDGDLALVIIADARTLDSGAAA